MTTSIRETRTSPPPSGWWARTDVSWVIVNTKTRSKKSSRVETRTSSCCCGGAPLGGCCCRLFDPARHEPPRRDDETRDLRRALVELHDLRVPHQLLDRVLLDEAVAAVDLHGVHGDLHRGVSREALRVRGGERVALAGVEQRA